ncbi:MAG: adenosylmethionine--8-amino-7-oxononanoate transaminase [Verrucomicrobia bacterium]|nr:adenosylmethionine--8-amino-7-oxononanoate transaminase [Verrucomicrobiota bacterium]
MDSLADKDRRHLWHPFTQMRDWMAEEPVIIERGQDARLWDTKGREYLDANASIWTNIHGHNHPRINAAIRAQLEKVAHSSFLGLSNVPAIELAEKLVSIAPGNGNAGTPVHADSAATEGVDMSVRPERLTRVFYSDDGSTAVEVALKMALQYWVHRGQPQRRRFVAFADAYHGDTIGAVSLGGIDLFHATYKPLLFEVDRVADAQQLRKLMRESEGNIAAVVIEPLIQGAAGMKLWPRGLLRDVAWLCDEHGALLIADEVMTGFGRTGTMFACQQENITPDFLCLAKGLTGGYLPLAATLTTEKVFSAFLGYYEERKTFFHGHSFTGNPLGCAAALASLAIFEEEDTLARLQPKISLLRDELQEFCKLKPVVEARQCGFIGAVEVGPYPWEAKAGIRVCQHARELGVLTRPIGNVIVIMPPLCVTEDELRKICDVLRRAVKEVLG